MNIMDEFEVMNLSKEEIKRKFVGRIDYIGFLGEVVERLYFTFEEEYLSEIKESADIGRPILTEKYSEEA